MANNPPTMNVLKYKGTGNVQVYPLLPTQLLGSQDGADVGTGGPGLATLESPSSGTFVHSRNIEFLDDRYALIQHPAFATEGVYKKDQGGAGNWGRVAGGNDAAFAGGSCTGLHVLHPAGKPTISYLYDRSTSDFYVKRSEDGVSADPAWTDVGTAIENNAASPASYGQSIVYRDSIVWAHQHFTGAAGAGAITQYDLNLNVLTRYSVGAGGLVPASWHGLHVHENTLFLATWRRGVDDRLWVLKLQAGSFVTVADTSVSNTITSTTYGHSALFTDLASGDLILLSPTAGGDRVWKITSASTSPVIVDISATVMGATQGADKYRSGGGAVSNTRRWAVNVDTESVPGTPRTFLTTWVPGLATETWEWKGVSAEMEAVSILAGISDGFALPYSTVSSGTRSPRTGAVEIGDTANPPVEAPSGTKFYFRGRGSAPVGVVTFYGADSEGTPDTVVPIAAASLTVESGSPPTTPTVSGNTIINFTPDSGATLYSVVLNVSAAGVGINEGDVGLLIPDFV